MEVLKLTNNRNRIMNAERFNQPILFQGMDGANGMFPTDVDAVLEYKGIGWLLYEVKTGNKWLSGGQERMFKEFAKQQKQIGRLVIVAVCRHDTDVDKPIMLKDTIVTHFLTNAGKTLEWKAPKTEITAKELQDLVLDKKTFERRLNKI